MKSKNFKLQEFLPRHVYEERNEKGWQLLDDRLIAVADRLKDKFPLGTMTINNWLWGGNRNWSGLRTPESPYYSPYSQHTFGRAFDAVFSYYKAEDVRKYLIDNKHEFPEITGIENFDGMTWVHVDVRNSDRVLIFEG